MFKWSRAAVTRMNGSITPDSSFLRPARVPYKVLYALLFTLLIVIIVLLLPTANHPTQLIAISAVERVDREGTSSGGTLTVVKDDCASFTYNTTYPLTPPRSKGTTPFFPLNYRCIPYVRSSVVACIVILYASYVREYETTLLSIMHLSTVSPSRSK